MSHPVITHHPAAPGRDRPSRRPRRRSGMLVRLVPLIALAAGCASAEAASPPTPPALAATAHDGHGSGHTMSTADRARAMLAAAGYQDVAVAEQAGYASSLQTLGCFQNAERGGMGVHYVNNALMDATVDIAKPEALVYELDATGAITGLVAHEYIVPVEAWTAKRPPALFGVAFHRHPTLPLWVLHTWLWKDNPTGVFEDWNPAVRQCPAGVPIFGVDLPEAAPGS